MVNCLHFSDVMPEPSRTLFFWSDYCFPWISLRLFMVCWSLIPLLSTVRAQYTAYKGCSVVITWHLFSSVRLKFTLWIQFGRYPCGLLVHQSRWMRKRRARVVPQRPPEYCVENLSNSWRTNRRHPWLFTHEPCVGVYSTCNILKETSHQTSASITPLRVEE